MYPLLLQVVLLPVRTAVSDEPKQDAMSMISADAGTDAGSPVYPRGVSLSGDRLWIVDSDAPGVWTIAWPTRRATEPELSIVGSRYLRKTMNRPFCAVVHPVNGVLVGDSATREVYHAVASTDLGSRRSAIEGQTAAPLNGGFLGIPMALAVSPDGQTIYVGDAERRAVFVLPVGGGTPGLVVRVNARGLVWQDETHLLAVTPDADAVVRIDVVSKTSEPVVTSRPYGFPGGIAWHGQTGFVSDVYGHCIWTFDLDGKTQKWFEGEPLIGPVGITATADELLVADPKTVQVYAIDRQTKVARPLLLGVTK